MGKNKYLSEDLKKRIADFHIDGPNQYQICQNLGISKGTVSKKLSINVGQCENTYKDEVSS